MSSETAADRTPNIERFVGLDIEATGSDVQKHGLIQIGVFVPTAEDRGDLFVSDVRPEPSVEFDPNADRVHRIARERMAQAPGAARVDEQLQRWLIDHGISRAKAHPVGFNVGSFDMPFVRRFLPNSALRLSWQTVDLNAILFTFADASRGQDTFHTLKDKAKDWAEKKVAASFDRDPQWHDAGYDALVSYYCWVYLLQLVDERTSGTL